MVRKKQIQPSILADEKKIAAMMEKNTAARQFTDEYKTYVENFKLGFKGRKVAGLPGKKDWFWDFAYRPNGQNPVHIIAKDEKTKKYLLIMQPRAPFEGKRFILSFPAGLKDIKNGAPEPALDTAISRAQRRNGICPTQMRNNFATPIA